MGKRKSGPFSGQQIVSKSLSASHFPTFFLIKRISSSNETFHSVSPFLVEKAILSNIGEVQCTKKLRSGDLLVEVHSRKQSEQIVKLKTFSNIQITVSPQASLNSSKGVITCGELLHVTTEEILKELQGQGVSHVRRISIRRDGQLLNTKHLILTFDSAKLPEHIKAGYMRLSVRAYIPNPLRCFKSSFKCHREYHFNSSSVTLQDLVDISADSSSKQSASTPRASSAITNLSLPSSLSVAALSEIASASPDLTDFKLVTNKKKLKKDSPIKTNNSIIKAEKISKFYTTSSSEVKNPVPAKDNISTHQSVLKPSATPKPTSVDTELLPMAVLPPSMMRMPR
ncbi:hypothetical protein AVEN_89510-1 [Araneus ventricosus]|uniref:Uncharacterized protein n=1 Tax=Araneus ventricosus TaxID=182803 RepID=A0A4Y2KKG5_ARAVE|nr:hypothetical protein AVEN_89510-1 [Araneus ventricosus]